MPPIEWLVGHVEVVHGTNDVVPAALRGRPGRTVYDLTSVRYPEMCLPASLAYPRLVALAAAVVVHSCTCLLDLSPPRS